MDGALSAAASAPAAPAAPWPALREDLQLFPAAANRDGSPAWMIQDPVGNRFFRIGWVEFEVLSRWALGEPARIAASISASPITTEAEVQE